MTVRCPAKQEKRVLLKATFVLLVENQSLDGIELPEENQRYGLSFDF